MRREKCGSLAGAAGQHGTAPFVVYLVPPLGTRPRIGHVPSFTFARISPRSAWQKSLPRHRPATTFSCCQSRETASINSSACSATATEFEPPLLQIGSV
jgi:hypothetical protein